MADMKSTRAAYGEALVELGKKDERLLVLDADLAGATQTKMFKTAFPDRHFNAGIAECNMVGMSAGLSTMGFVPFCSTFAIFGAGRAYEIFRNSVAYPNLNVKLACTHAGITVGEDGGSHQAIEDIALMRVIPGVTLVVPADAREAAQAVEALLNMDGPAYLRLGRADIPVLDEATFELGRARVLKDGQDLAIFACGHMVHIALEAARILEAEGKSVAVINIHTIKPLDEATVLTYAQKCGKVVTAEEHSIIGGLGDAVAAAIIGKGSFNFTKIGVSDRFGQSGKVPALLKEYGLDVQSVTAKLREILG